MGSQAGPRRDIWGLATFWLRMIGFLLLFLGTIVVVALGTFNGGCINTTACGPTSTFAQARANAIWAAAFLWTFGLAAIGAGSAVKLHFTLKQPTSGRPEEYRWVLGDRLANYAVFGLTIALLFLLLEVYITGFLPGSFP